MSIIDIRYKYAQRNPLSTPHIGALLHHSVTDILASASTFAEQAHIDSIHRYHVGRGWVGIGYHKVVMPSGRLYWVGDPNTQRAHVLNKNHLFEGIVIIGDYSSSTPTEAAQDAVREALELSGLPLVGGHREHQSGKGICPGFWDFDRLKHPKPPELSRSQMAWAGANAATGRGSTFITPSHEDNLMEYYELKRRK
jgi:hypothetical protein